MARRAFLETSAIAGAAAIASLAATDASAQGGGNKINTARDWMLFTDKSRTAGVICTGSASIAVTSAFVQGFEATYFNANWKTAPTPADLRSKANGLEGGGSVSAARLDQAVSELVTATGVFSMSSTAQTLPAPSTRTDRAPGQLALSGKQVWRPGGEITTRLAGSSTITLVVGPQDLRGKLTPSTRLGAVGLISGRPSVIASNDGCGACGACGLCAICALCGEVNAGSVALIGAASVSLTALSSINFAPTALDPITDRLPPGVRDLQQISLDVNNSLSRLTAAATKVRGS